MQLDAAPTVAPSPTVRYTQQLAAVRDQLAYVTGAPIDTPQRIDIALGHLHAASAGIHQALAGAGALPTALPGGVTSYPREAARQLDAAIAELGRATTGSPVDAPLVDRSVRSAADRLQQAIGLALHPPTDTVYDGS